jgi:hypothetical protein
MRTRPLVTALALLTSGTIIGVTTQHIASADVSAGNRPVLIQITPCRITDTRPAPQTAGPRSVPLGPADTHTIDVQVADTDCTGKIPTDASAVALNITSLGATQQSFLTIWAGGDRPDASSLNPSPGAPPTPNAVTTELSVDQDFKIYNDTGSVNIVIDITGYYVAHDHDDRYYTEAEIDGSFYSATEIDDGFYTQTEVDALLAADGPEAWGMSRGDGSLRTQSPNVVEVLHPGVGRYCVVFDPPITGTGMEAAVISGAGSGPVFGENQNGIGGADACAGAPNQAGLELQIYNEAGVLSDERFTFVVP